MVKLSLFFSMVMALGNLNTAPPVPAQIPQSAIMMTQDELKFVDLVNKERMSRGEQMLRVDPLLVEVARQHSREMGDKRYFSHTSPTPSLKTPLDRYLSAEKRRPSWALVGENLFYCSIVDVNRGHTALMNSEGHRANILEDKFQRIGVGTYVNPRGEFYVTQMFLAKTDE